MKSRQPLTYAIVALMLSSCYSNIDLDKYREDEGENMLVLNSVLTTDSTIAVCATRLWYYTDGETISYYPQENTKVPVYVDDLDISLNIDGQDMGSLTYDPQKKLYVSDIKPLPGNHIEYSTSFLGKAVKASETMPQIAEIESVRVEVERKAPVENTHYNDYTLAYYITFTDKPEEQNFYYLNFKTLRQDIPDYTYEFVFSQMALQVSSGNPGWEPFSLYGLPFSDQGIDGTTHTIVLKQNILSLIDIDYIDHTYGSYPVTIQLYAISEGYYNYQIGLLRTYAQDETITGALIDIGIASPTKIYSNIQGGAGIFGCCAGSVETVDILPLLR